jgi:hypothetical protein
MFPSHMTVVGPKCESDLDCKSVLTIKIDIAQRCQACRATWNAVHRHHVPAPQAAHIGCHQPLICANLFVKTHLRTYDGHRTQIFHRHSPTTYHENPGPAPTTGRPATRRADCLASRYIDEPQPLLVWVPRLRRKVKTERGIFVSLVWAKACLLLPYDGEHVIFRLGRHGGG